MKKRWVGLIIIGIVVIIVAAIIFTQNRNDSNEIRIGAILPLTGDGAMYGQMARMAIDLAVQEINSDGGIKGKNIIVIYEDTQLDPKIATQAVQKLITVDKVLAIVGPMASNTLLAVAPEVERNKVILISPSATSQEITNAGDYIFRTIVSDIYDGTAMAQYAYNERNYRRVAVFYVNEAGPKGVSQAFIQEFVRLGGSIVSEEAGTRDGADFRSQITKIKNSNPDAAYFAGYAKETVIFLKQAKELNLDKQLMTHQLIDDPDVIKRAGDTANDVIFTTPKLTPETGGGAVKMFFDKFQNQYGQQPENFAPNAYDAVNLLAHAMRDSGISDESIKQGLYNVREYDGASGRITIDENGDVIQPMMIMRIDSGRAIPIKNR